MAVSEPNLPPAGYIASEKPVETDPAGNPKKYNLKRLHEVKSVYELEKYSPYPAIIRNFNNKDKFWGDFPMTFVPMDNGATISGISSYIGARLVDVVPATDPVTQVKIPVFGQLAPFADITKNPCGRPLAVPFTNSGAFQVQVNLTGTTNFGATRSILDQLLEGVDFPCDSYTYGWNYVSKYSRWYANGSDGTTIFVGPYIIHETTPLSPPSMHPYIIQGPYTDPARLQSLVRLDGDDYLMTFSALAFTFSVIGPGGATDSWPTTTAVLLSPFDYSYYPNSVSSSRALSVPSSYSQVKGYVNQFGEINYTVSGRFYNTWEEGNTFWKEQLGRVTKEMLTNNRVYDSTTTGTRAPLGGAYITANLTVKGRLNRSTGQIDIVEVQRVDGWRVDAVAASTSQGPTTWGSLVAAFPSIAPDNIVANRGPQTCGVYIPPCYVEYGSYSFSPFSGLPSHYSEVSTGKVYENRIILDYLGQGCLLSNSIHYYSPTNNPADFSITAMFYGEGVIPILDRDPFGSCGTYYVGWKPQVEANSSSMVFKNAGVTGSSFPNVRSKGSPQYSLDNGLTWSDFFLDGATFGGGQISRMYRVILGGGCAILYQAFPDNKIYLFNKGTITEIPKSGCLDDGLAGYVLNLIAPMSGDQFLMQIEYDPGTRAASSTATLVANSQKQQVILNSSTQITILNDGLITAVTAVEVTFSNSNTYTFASATISGNDSNILTFTPAIPTSGITGISVSYTRTGGSSYVYRLIAVSGVLTTPKMTHVKWESIYSSSYIVGTRAAGSIDPTFDMSYPFLTPEYPPLELADKVYTDVDISVETKFVNTIPYNGGAPPVTVVITAGILPRGLTLGSSGLIDGVLNNALITTDMNGTGFFIYTFTVQASDSLGNTASKEYSIKCVE